MLDRPSTGTVALGLPWRENRPTRHLGASLPLGTHLSFGGRSPGQVRPCVNLRLDRSGEQCIKVACSRDVYCGELRRLAIYCPVPRVTTP